VRTATAGAVLALVVALAFWPVVSGARSFLQMDLRYEHVPIWHVVQQVLRHGDSPFWVDSQYCGNPLLFTQEAPLFYPLTVPLLSTGAPAHRLSDLFSLFHFWLAGFASYLLLRDLETDPFSALFGGVAWMICARMVQSAIWPNAVAAAALLPLVLTGIFRIAGGRRRSGLALAAVSGGLCLLTARPQVIVGAAPLFLTAAATALFLSAQRWRAIADLAIAGTLAAMLGAPSIVPAAILRPETSRAEKLARSSRDLSPLSAGADLDQVFLPVDGPRRWPEAAAYPGALVFFLAAAGVVLAVRRRNEFPRALAGGLLAGGLAGLLFAFGERGPLGLIADLPLVRGFRIPARYLTSWSLALAIVSSLVLARLVRDSKRPRTIAAVCLLGLSFELILHARRAAPTAPSDVYSTEPDLTPLLRKVLAADSVGFPRRLWSFVFPPFLWMYPDAEKVAVARKFEPFYGAFGMSWGLESVGGNGPSLRRWKLLFAERNIRVGQLAGVGAVIVPSPGWAAAPIGSPQPVVVQRFPGFPRVIVVPEAVVVAPSAAIAATLDEALDPRSTAVLEEGSPMTRDPRWDPAKASVRLRSRAPGRVSVSATLPGDGVLVVFNSFEKGWQARVDGAPARVLAADAAFQGIRLPAGEHTVDLRYRPRGLAAGIVLGVVGLLGLLVVGAARFRDA
jgi:Bacterial membrane protein YfhO